MLAFQAMLAALGILVVVPTALSFVRSRAWWVRIFDFPRAQIALGGGVVLGLFGLANVGRETAGAWEWGLTLALASAVAAQGWQMLPYTRFWRCQVPTAPPDAPADRRLRLVISNVSMENRNSARWREVVCGANPDVIVAVEVDEWWDRALQGLGPDYPHHFSHPQNNTYGLAVYSRFPLRDPIVRHLVEADVPSLFTSLELPSGRLVRCVLLHPRPPRPDVPQDSDMRDAELVLAARIVRDFQSPTIVAGDLNDVAWSHTTHLFQRIARLLDPRIGRGLFATFHADHRWMRWPLDHVFPSAHFDVVDLRRLRHVGSDHFPMFIELALRADDEGRAAVPVADREDEQEATEAVRDAQELRAHETTQERRERKRADR